MRRRMDIFIKIMLLEQKIRLLDHPVCSPDLNPKENLWGLVVAKDYMLQKIMEDVASTYQFLNSKTQS